VVLDNGYQHIYADGNPGLGLSCILGGLVESLDSQVLFDPFEEKLNLLAALVYLRDGQARQGKVVGQKDEPPVLFGVVEADARSFSGQSFLV
jgi:hypothetical protein